MTRLAGNTEYHLAHISYCLPSSSTLRLLPWPKLPRWGHPEVPPVYRAREQELEKTGNVRVSLDIDVARVKRGLETKRWGRLVLGTSDKWEVVEPDQRTHEGFEAVVVATGVGAAL